jgi:hypothetical protein
VIGGCLTLSITFMFGSSGLTNDGTVSVFQPFFAVSSQTCVGVGAFFEMSAFYCETFWLVCQQDFNY